MSELIFFLIHPTNNQLTIVKMVEESKVQAKYRKTMFSFANWQFVRIRAFYANTVNSPNFCNTLTSKSLLIDDVNSKIKTAEGRGSSK